MKEKISLVLMVFGVIISFQLFTLSLDKKYINLYNEKEKLEKEIEELYIPQKKSFEDSMKRITRYISETDQFLGIGGVSGNSPEYFDSKLYEEIMNSKDDESFNSFLTKTEFYFSERSNFFDSLPSIWPLDYSPVIKITSSFGERFSPFTGKLQLHTGIDMVSSWKSKILSTAPGVVLEYYPPPGTKINGVVHKGHPVFGGYVVIDHQNGYRTHYAHLSEIYVNRKTKIIRGTVLGRMGNTGLSSGEHLHYGIEKFDNEKNEWVFIDPINFLRGTR